MDLMQLIEAHTTYAPKAPTNVPAPVEVNHAADRQARFDTIGLPRLTEVA